MSEEVKINVNVSDNGTTAKANKEAASLHDNLEKAAKAAASVRIPNPVASAKQVVDAVNAPKGTPFLNASKQPQTPANGSGDSNTARGVGGLTGAAGRDFAAQAQGLGGLVHVYATFAANIFAVTAAFGALKEAMNTAHLLQGIEQLSAQSGKNLSSLAGSLNKVTDGALSLKSSLSAVATASAIGLTNSQVLKMGEVAKKASQAMGYDMANAMDRLTTGIGKNRPQLLDELGIIVSANTIYSNYAREVGKTALTLTDYEKKQAFANAVLQQGLDKFGAIDIPTNPFNKLEASMLNIMQTGLGLIDKVLGPIAKYLAESPGGLAVAMGLIASVLLKQAIPALGAFRENAKRLASESLNTLTGNLAEATQRREAMDLVVANALEDEFKITNAKKLGMLERTRLNTSIVGGEVRATVKKSIFDQTPEEIKTAQAMAAVLQNSDNALEVAQGNRLQAYLDARNNMYATANKQIEAGTEEHIAKTSSQYSHIAQMQLILNKDLKNASNRRILAITAETAAIEGPVAAWKKLNSDIATSKAGKATVDVIDALGETITKQVPKTNALANGWTRLKGGVSIATSAVSTALNAFSIWGQVIGLAVAGLAVLDGVLSKATEQQDEFNSKITEGNSAIKTAGDALDYLAKKSKNAIGIEAVSAMTNAMDGLTTAVEGQILALKKWQDAAGVYDKIKDTIAGIVGSSNVQVLAKDIGNELQSALGALVFTPALQKEFQSKLADLLKVDPETIHSGDAIGKALNKSLDGLENGTANKLLDEVASLLSKTKEADAASTAASKSFADSLKAVGEEVDTVVNKLQFKDGIGKLGSMIEDTGTKMAEAMANPIKSFDTLLSMAKKPELLAILSMNGGPDLIKNITELTNLKAKLTIAVQDVAKAEVVVGIAPSGSKKDLANAALTEAKAALSTISKDISEKQAQIFTPVLETLNTAGAKMIDTALKDAVGKAELSKSMNHLAGAQAAGLITVNEERDIKLAELKFKEQELTASYELQVALINNTIELEKSNAQSALSTALKNKDEAAIISAVKVLSSISIFEDIKAGAKVDITNTKGVLPEVLAAAIARAQQLDRAKAGLSNARAGIGAEVSNINENAALKIPHERNRLMQEFIKSQATITTQSLVELSLQEKYAAGYNAKLAAQRLSLELDQAESTFSLEQETILNKIIDLRSRNANGQLEGFDQKRQELEIEKEVSKRKFETAKAATFLRDKESSIANTLAIQKSTLDAILSIQQTRVALANQEDEIATTILGQLKEQGLISENLYNDKLKRIALDKAERDFGQKALENSQARALAEAEYNKQLTLAKEAARFSAQQNFSSSEKDTVRISPDQAAKDAKVSPATQTAYDTTISKLNDINTLNNKGLEFQKKQIELQYTYLDLLKQQKELQDGLTAAFGTFGTALYSVAKALIGMDAQSKADNLELIAQQDKLAAAKAEAAVINTDPNFDPKDRIIANKAVSDSENAVASAREKSTKNELLNTAKLASAAKGLFKEKTAGYKILGAVEKAATIASQVESAKKLAIEAGSALKSIGIDIPAIYAKFMAMMGPYGAIAASAAIAAFVGIGGKGGSAPPAGFTAEEQQKVNGTGQTYVNGALQANGGGKLGDITAVSTTIKDGIDLLSKTNFELLDFNKGDMYKALVAIRDNTENFVKALNVQTGITGGLSPFGTVQGSSKSFLGFSSSSTSIEDTGIIIKGLLSDLVAGKGTKQQYENVKSSSSSFFGLFSDSSSSTNLKGLQETVNKYITNIFTAFTDSLVSAASTLGSSEKAVTDKLSAFVVNTGNISGLGLTGEEFANKVMATIGTELDKAAAVAFPNLKILQDQFQHFGESTSDFVIRLVNDAHNVKLAFESINKSSSGLSTTNIETLVKAFGSLDGFLSAMASFHDNFLTSTEQLVPTQAAVTAEMDRLGLSSITTREQFAGVIKQLDLTSAGDQQLYIDLMNVSKAFAEVHPEIRKITSAADILANKVSQQLDIYKLEGRTDKALLETRKAELAAMDNSLKVGQLYIYALQDEVALKDKLKVAYNKESQAIKGTISALTSSITTLKNYRNSLDTGATSNLTPLQKYAEIKSQATQVLATATGVLAPGASDSEKQAKSDAINSLPGIATTFLEASRTLFASSDIYNQDVSLVKSVLDNTTMSLETQQTDAEKQLERLDAQVSSLIDITDGIRTTNSILADLSYAMDTANTAQDAANRSGYVAEGVLAVGAIQDSLSELRDVMNTTLTDLGVIFSDGMKTIIPVIINNDADRVAIASELAGLRAEVASLRSENAAQSVAAVRVAAESAMQLEEAIKKAAEVPVVVDDWSYRIGAGP